MRRRNAIELPYPICYKRFFYGYTKFEELPYKLKLLNPWKLSPIASKYLS